MTECVGTILHLAGGVGYGYFASNAGDAGSNPALCRDAWVV